MSWKNFIKQRAESSSYKWWVLIVIQYAMFLVGVTNTIVNLALPIITKDFLSSVSVTQWLMSGYLIFAAVSLPIAGRLADVFGRKNIFIIGTILFTITSFFCATAPSLKILIAMRLLQGIGVALLMGNSNATLATVFPEHQHGLAMSSSITVFAMSMALGATGGGYLIQLWGWRSMFFVNFFMGILAIILGLIIFIEEKISHKHKEPPLFDLLGSLLFIATVGGIMTGLITYLNPLGISYLPFVFLIFGFFSFAVFLFVELRSSYPLLNVRLYKIPAFTVGNIVRILIEMLQAGTLFILPFYTLQSLYLTPSESGMIFLPIAIGIVIFGPLAGHFSYKFGARLMTTIGFALDVVAFILFISLNESGEAAAQTSTYIKLLLGNLLIGMGSGMIMGPNNSATLQAIPHTEKGVSSGFLFTQAYLGGALVSALCAYAIHWESTKFSLQSLVALNAKTDVAYVLLFLAIAGVFLCGVRPRKNSKCPN